MYLIIAGCNEIGISLANMLSSDGHDIAIIDRDPSKFAKLGAGSNYLMIDGMPIDEDILKQAGIEKADGIYAVTDDDNTNIMVAEIASKLYQIQHTMVRIDDPVKQKVMRSLCMQVICPITLCVDQLYQAVDWRNL
jgi:trk system potassium uptake protein TrkA